jgi:flagellar L-ring protein precursor FlgH
MNKFMPLILQKLVRQISGFACSNVSYYAAQAHHSFSYQLLKYFRHAILVISIFALTGCSDTLERLKRVGKSPEFANLEVPNVEEDDDELDRWQEREQEQRAHQRKTNSLWEPGSTKFFRDSRAWGVGDIIKVVVVIKDQASLDNSTKQNRAGSDSLGFPKLFGKEKAIASTLGNNVNVSNLVSTNSNRAHSGSGTISRKEDISTEIAAVVSKVLPNGNLIIQGHQEVRVNHELREIKIAGIIRPKDIASDNSIQTNQIAEARISYGGRGVVSDVQQPRVGSQVIDIISPF